MLVNASLKLALASNRGATTSNRLAGQAKRSSVDRAFDVRAPRDHRDRDVGPQVRRARSGPGSSRGLATAARPLKPPLSLPLPSSAKPSGPNGVASAMLLSATSSDEVGQRERLVARRRKQLVDLAPADLAVDQPAAQPDAARDDAIDLEAAVPLQPHLDDARGARSRSGCLGSPMTRLLTSWVRRPTRSRW